MSEPQPSSYEILAKLSRGSDVPAELFAARATGVERLVVIKRLRRDAAKEASIAQAFLAEARVAAKLAHPNIAQVYEVGKLGGSYFFTTEYVDGETLNALISHARGKKVQVPIRAFLTIAAGAAAGLHHAHERNGIDGKSLGIVHGNISPTNVMISREGIVKVLDFGLARSTTAKPAYSSPEQVRGDKLDRRSDLFSLGVVLWELLTLGDLHARDNAEETRNAVDSYEPPPPSARRFDVPPELDTILVKLLAKAPADRYQTGGELLASIEALAVKLGFSLSTTDLARMIRLWFTPSGQGEEPEELKPITVASQDILAEVSIGPDPVDELLASVREAAAFIRTMAQKLNAGRPERLTNTPIPTGTEHDATREDFAQIRDRILEQARKRKETKSPPVGMPLASIALASAPASSVAVSSAAASASEDAPKRKRPDTLSSKNPYSYITAVAETATAPIANATKADASSALKALQATQAHVETTMAANDEVAKPSLVVDKPSDATTVISPPEVTTPQPAKVEAQIAAKETAKADAKSEVKAAAKSEVKAAAKAEAKSAPSTSKNGVSAKVSEVAARTSAAVETDDEDEPPRRSGWIMPAVVVLAAAVVLIFVLKGRGNKSTTASGTGSSQVVASNTTGAGNGMGTADTTATGSANVVTAAGSNALGSSAGSDTLGSTPALGSSAAAAGSAAAGSATAGSTATGSTTSGSTTATTTTMAATNSAGSNAVVATNAGSGGTSMAAGSNATGTTGTTDKTGDKTTNTTTTKTVDKTTNTTTTKTGDKTTNTTTTKTGDKTTNTTTTKTADNKATNSNATIEDLYAKGDYAKTNAACSTNTLFTPQRLQSCALAACRTNNTALAKRWVNAISKASRPDLIAQCKSLGLDLEAPAPAP